MTNQTQLELKVGEYVGVLMYNCSDVPHFEGVYMVCENDGTVCKIQIVHRYHDWAEDIRYFYCDTKEEVPAYEGRKIRCVLTSAEEYDMLKELRAAEVTAGLWLDAGTAVQRKDLFALANIVEMLKANGPV